MHPLSLDSFQSLLWRGPLVLSLFFLLPLSWASAQGLVLRPENEEVFSYTPISSALSIRLDFPRGESVEDSVHSHDHSHTGDPVGHHHHEQHHHTHAPAFFFRSEGSEIWQSATYEHDRPDDFSTEEESRLQDYQSEYVFLVTSPGSPLEFRLLDTGADGDYTLTFEELMTDGLTSPSVTLASASLPGVGIIPRELWGADESLRISRGGGGGSPIGPPSVAELRCEALQRQRPEEFATESRVISSLPNGSPLRWPQRYSSDISKVVIHHTATNADSIASLSSQELVQAIYRFHAVSRGWGDVGYHYLIAPDGGIYEGKAGGEGVIGGHAYCYNTGTIGVSLIGNFQNTEPTPEQISALYTLLPSLGQTYELDLSADSLFHGDYTPNLLGHRDVGATACPGNFLYDYLPDLREFLRSTPELDPYRVPVLTADFLSEIGLLDLRESESRSVTYQFENTSDTTWSQQNTWLFGSLGDGIEFVNADSSLPYEAARMQESSVAPGETASFQVSFRRTDESASYLATGVLFPIVDGQKVSGGELLQPISLVSPTVPLEVVERQTWPRGLTVGTQGSTSFSLRNTDPTTLESGQAFASVWLRGEIMGIQPVPAIEPGAEATLQFPIEPDLPGDQELLLILSAVGREPTLFSSAVTVYPPELASGSIAGVVRTSDSGLLVEYQNTSPFAWNGFETGIESGGVFYPLPTLFAEPSGQGTVLLPADSRAPFSLVWRGQTLDIATGIKDTPIPLRSPTPEPTPAPEASGQDAIRIRLGYPSASSSIVLTPQDSWSLLDASGRVVDTGARGEVLALERVGENLQYDTELSEVFRLESFSVLIPSWDRQYNLFRGNIELRSSDSDRKILVINELLFADYMRGIAETVSQEHPAKRQAIAILSRSYARNYQSGAELKYPGEPYDGSDDPAEFQLYFGEGYAQRAGHWLEILADTQDLVLTYEDTLVKPPYHSCSGGRTSSAQEIWGWEDTPYLVATEDPGGIGRERRGHGVGLSGCGAEHLAQEEGLSRDQIIEYYYPGTEVISWSEWRSQD